MRKKLRASITLLIVCMFPALILATCVSLDVSRYYGTKVTISSAVDVGINSVLASYDREYQKEYKVLGFDPNEAIDAFGSSLQASLADRGKITKATPNAGNTQRPGYLFSFFSTKNITFFTVCSSPLSTSIYNQMVLLGQMNRAEATRAYSQVSRVLDNQDASMSFVWPGHLRDFYPGGIRIGDIQTAIDKHNKETDETKRKEYVKYISDKVRELESVYKNFEGMLDDGTRVHEAGWFYIDDFYGEISLSKYRELKRILKNYKGQDLPILFEHYSTWSKPYAINTAPSETFMRTHGKFASGTIEFARTDVGNLDSMYDVTRQYISPFDDKSLTMFDDAVLSDTAWLDRSLADLVDNPNYFDRLWETAHGERFKNRTMQVTAANYIVDSFSNYNKPSKKKSISPRGETEFIIAGSTDNGKNLQIVFNKIFVLRLAENLRVADASQLERASSYTPNKNYIYAELYKFNETNFRWAIVESYVETYLLMERNVPINFIKTSDNMITDRIDLINKLNLSTYKPKVTKGNEFTYDDALRLLLAFSSNRSYATDRAADVINENMALRYDDAADIGSLLTQISISVDADIQSDFTRALKLPGTNTSNMLNFERFNLYETGQYAEWEY